jgi:hypothetical protein
MSETTVKQDIQKDFGYYSEPKCGNDSISMECEPF